MRLRRTVESLIASAFALAAVIAMGSSRPAHAAAGAPVTVGLSTLTPSVVTKTDTLHLSGQLVTGSGSTRANAAVRLAVADMGVRSDLNSTPGTNSRQIYGHDYQLGSLAAGTTTGWSLSVPISDLYLPGRGVYALDVEVLSSDERIGALRTYLPYWMGSDTSFTPTQLVVLWPVTGTPELDGHSVNGVPEAAGDQLAADFATGGRLDQVLTSAAAAKKVTVSWALDPDLLRTASSLSYGYVLRTNQTGSTGDSAARWLTEAKSILGQNTGEVWQLPATDPDLGSLSTANKQLATEAVRKAASLSASTVDQLTGRNALGTLAWPVAGQADAGTLALAQGLGPSATIVRSDSIDLRTPSQRYTPTGRAKLSGGTQVAVSDAGLDAVFDGDTIDSAYRAAHSDSSLLAAQRFLAQSALIALERPNLGAPRTIMVTAARAATPDPALLTAIGQATWLQTVGLSTLLNAAPDTAARTSAPTRSAATTSSDLSADRLAHCAALNSKLLSLAAILIDPTKATDAYSPAVLRTVSTAWRTAPAAQTAFANAVDDQLTGSVNAVALVPKSDLTLSGKSGVIPFTIQNKLSYPVRVGIRITTDHPGLTVPSVAVETVPQGSTTVNVHVNASVTGAKVTVTAQLITPTGSDYGQSRSVMITVSSLGSTTLVIFGLSAALLVAAVVLRIYRSRRTRGAQDKAAAPGESAETSAAAGADREQ